MATGRMQKVLIAGFRQEAEGLLRKLQGLAIFHPAPLDILIEKDNFPAAGPDEKETSRESLKNVEASVRFLKSYLPRPGFFSSLAEGPLEKNEDEFYSIADSDRSRDLLREATALREEIDSLRDNIRLYRDRLEELEPLRDLDLPLGELPRIKNARFAAGYVATAKLSPLLAEPALETDVIQQGPKKTLVLLAAHRDDTTLLREALSRYGITEIDLQAMDDSPTILYHRFQEYLEQTTDVLRDREGKAQNLAQSHTALLVLLEYLLGLEKRRDFFKKWVLTPHTFIATGWVPVKDMDRLMSLGEEYGGLEIVMIDPGEEEAPPVFLENPGPVKPFELITRLYSFPRYGSVDPSAITGIFFALFFGLCLTDAGYGLILALIALAALFKVKKGRDLLWILFWGGIATVGAGLATGGIFGDLFRSTNPYVGADSLARFRESLLVFDPMVEPMSFFRLVLFLGLVHVITGLVVGTWHALREGRFLDAVADHASWLVIVLSLVGILFASEMSVKMALVTATAPPLPAWIISPAAFSAGGMALVVFLFGGRDESSLFFRFFIGFLKLLVLSGIFSYLGDILSYIRLMALGMVTAGIGMAINTIAFMLSDVPLVGVVLTGVVLLLGHTFNMAINLLGGFVHTLRLQYVEFFSKFFRGGGEAFRPLSYDSRYVKIL